MLITTARSNVSKLRILSNQQSKPQRLFYMVIDTATQQILTCMSVNLTNGQFVHIAPLIFFQLQQSFPFPFPLPVSTSDIARVTQCHFFTESQWGKKLPVCFRQLVSESIWLAVPLWALLPTTSHSAKRKYFQTLWWVSLEKNKTKKTLKYPDMSFICTPLPVPTSCCNEKKTSGLKLHSTHKYAIEGEQCVTSADENTIPIWFAENP